MFIHYNSKRNTKSNEKEANVWTTSITRLSLH